MSEIGNLQSDDLVRLALASQGQSEAFDDDDDDESFGAFSEFDDDDDDESWEFDDDDDDESFLEFAEDDDDDDDEGFTQMLDGENFAERRRRRRRRSFRRPRFRRFTRRSKIGRVKGARSTTIRGKGGQQMRVRFGKSFATSADVNKLIKSTELKFAAAMKERKANHSRLSKEIAKATRNLDGKITQMRKKMKELEQRAQTSSLMGLLQGAPKATTIKLLGDEAGALENEVLKAEIEFEKPDMMLPLLLGGGLGSGGGDQSLLLALAFSNKD